MLCRGDLMKGEGGKRAAMHVLKATARQCEDVAYDRWRLASLTSLSSALGSIHHSYVLGDSLGRFELLRMLSGRIIRAEIALWASRLQLWAAQSGLSGDMQPISPDLDDVCTCGMWIDERALEMMSSSQLQEVLLNAELAALHESAHLSVQ